MNDRVDHTVQKLEGKAQQLQGEIKQHTGDKLGGAMDKIQGKAKEDMADLQLRAKESMPEDDDEA